MVDLDYANLFVRLETKLEHERDSNCEAVAQSRAYIKKSVGVNAFTGDV